MQRAKDFPSEDYYLSPYDGHLAKLFVQSTQAIYDANPNSTWRRTFIRNRSPLMLRVANWVLHTLPVDGREPTGEDVALMGLKWIPGCAALLFLVSSICIDYYGMLIGFALDVLSCTSLWTSPQWR